MRFDGVFDPRFFQNVAGSVALDRRLGVDDLARDCRRQFDRDRFVVVENSFAFHAVFQVMDGVAEVLFFDFVLVVFTVHEHEQRVGEIRVGHRLLVQNHDVKFIVTAEYVFHRGVGQKIFHLPFVREARAARTIDIRAQHDHRLAVDHNDVANTNFFCRFHRECT